MWSSTLLFILLVINLKSSLKYHKSYLSQLLKKKILIKIFNWVILGNTKHNAKFAIFKSILKLARNTKFKQKFSNFRNHYSYFFQIDLTGMLPI